MYIKLAGQSFTIRDDLIIAEIDSYLLSGVVSMMLKSVSAVVAPYLQIIIKTAFNSTNMFPLFEGRSMLSLFRKQGR